MIEMATASRLKMAQNREHFVGLIMLDSFIFKISLYSGAKIGVIKLRKITSDFLRLLNFPKS